jgi:hypothetical protein
VAETSKISKIVEILANDLFAQFLWPDTGGWNQNWSCVRDDHTVKKRRSKVPSPSEERTANGQHMPFLMPQLTGEIVSATNTQPRGVGQVNNEFLS